MATTHVFAKTVQLPTRCEVVFWDLLEPEHVAEYDSRFRSWIPRDQPPRVGTRVDFVAKVFGIWSRGTSEFTSFEPPQRIELELVSPPSPLGSRLGWNLTDSDTGCTFEYQFEIRAPRGLGWLAKSVLGQLTSHLETELPALVERYR